MQTGLRRRPWAGLEVVVALGLLGLASIAEAQPSADQVLTDAGLSAGDKQAVGSGQFVDVSISGVSERDLSFATAFLVKSPPGALGREMESGDFVTADTQVKVFGELKGAGSLADLASLTLTDDEALTLVNAKPGEALNLSASEMAAFRALGGAAAPAVQEQLRRVLLARYQAYRASGLAGIAPYDRGSGRTGDLAADLRRASQATQDIHVHLPGFQKVLLGYPQAALPGMQERFFWLKSVIHDETTYVLVHFLVAADGAARVFARREYYVSTGYNAEQTLAGFLPVQGGTMVISTVHAFTDQVTGFGGSIKRGIGSKVMAGQMKKIYEAEREKSEKAR